MENFALFVLFYPAFSVVTVQNRAIFAPNYLHMTGSQRHQRGRTVANSSNLGVSVAPQNQLRGHRLTELDVRHLLIRGPFQQIHQIVLWV